MTHNKKRNTALLVEFLKKSIVESLVNNDNVKAKNAYKIIKSYFSKTELREEKNLYDIVINTIKAKNLDDSAKLCIIEEAYGAYTRLDRYKIEKLKDKLIREINHKLGASTYSFSLDNYRLCALVNSIWNTKNRLDRSKYLGMIKDEVNKLNDLTVNKNKGSEIDKGLINERVLNKYVLREISKKYDEMTKDLLIEQKEVLKHYIEYVFANKNDNEFGKYVDEKRKGLTQKLNEITDKVKTQEAKNKIIMVTENLNNMNGCPCKGSMDRTLKYIMEIQELISKWESVNK